MAIRPDPTPGHETFRQTVRSFVIRIASIGGGSDETMMYYVAKRFGF